MNSKTVLILGAGVSGLTTALKLLQAGHSVSIWSKEGSDAHPHTSASAYAMWVPVKMDADPRIERWTNEGFTAFEKLSTEAATGVVMRQIFQLKTEKSEPWFAASFVNFRHAHADEISADYADAHVLDKAPVIDPPTYLDWLRAQVLKAGGVIEKRTVQSLDEAPATFDVVVNCAGLGARELASDSGVHADRVQVITIKDNGFDKVMIDDEGPHKRACIVPQSGYLKLGAVFDGKHETLEVDDAHTQSILDRCNKMAPTLNARREDILEVIRAIRPEREGWLPRVQRSTLADGRTLVHNYGHDGMGYILSHGIADEIVGYLNAM